MAHFKIGAAKKEITPKDLKHLTFLGWGQARQSVKGVATPLFARAIAIFDPLTGNRLVMVCLDVCFISELLRQEVLKRVSLSEHEVILSATHTHSAPGGYSSYVLYSLSTNGFSPKVLEDYVAGTVAAIEAAIEGARPGEIKIASGEFPLNLHVAFNRSLDAWKRNPECKGLQHYSSAQAVDRQMMLLRFDTLDGAPIACWNWFAVHATSMHNDQHLIHSDNKGVAANLLESALFERGHAPFVGVFAQSAAGDVSPNFKRFFGLKETRGVSRQDEESCQANAKIQCDLALALFDQAGSLRPLGPGLESVISYYDFSSVVIDPDFVNGRVGMTTGPAEVGLPQLRGTAEGRGIAWWVYGGVWISDFVYRVSKALYFRAQGKRELFPWQEDPVQGNKVTVIEAGRSRMFGAFRLEKLVFPSWIDPTIARLKSWARGLIKIGRPFTPQILPIQLARFGELLIAAVPGEFTTVSGSRLRAVLKKEFPDVNEVVIQGYANAFASYITTPEEYPCQNYEGGCTLFGRWTLPAYLTLFRKLARALKTHEYTVSALRPAPPDREYLKIMERLE